ncbi:MAG: flagellar motor protein MotB [Flavobacterium sp.]|nr:MAG: flagellar motor protein MotB [Flavobacterium sp.]
MRRKLFLFVALLTLTAISAQQKLKDADKFFAEFAYVDAAEAYEDYLKDGKKPGTQTISNIADSFYFTNNFSKALMWYKRLIEVSGEKIDIVHFKRYLHTLKALGKHDEANVAELQWLSKKGNAKAIAKFTVQRKFLDSLNAVPPQYALTNLETNSDKADFGTAFYGNKIVYSSSKDDKMFAKDYRWNQQPFLELFVADRNPADGAFLNEEKFMSKDLGSYHNAALTFTADGNTVYFSTNTTKPGARLKNADDGTNNIRIMWGIIEEGRLKNVEPLRINNINYSVGHPALTPDGKWLFFTSDMPGGFGGSDIYVAAINENGSLGKPKNLGDKINTSGKEMFPFVSGTMLYFSSDGHHGMGGLDVFESLISGKLEFGEPKNMGNPINSNRDDFAFVIDSASTFGYISSNRKGGKGDDDIYYFTKKPHECRHIVSGMIKHKVSKTPINLAEVRLYYEAGALISSVNTSEDGKYSFEVSCSTKFVIEASKPEHSSDRKEVITTNKPETKDVDLELATYEDLVKKEDEVEVIDINPIFFAVDKYNITAQAKIELDKVVYIMKNFPSVVIRIESHTDSRASDDYNLVLSNNRAQATFEYITSHGINAERIESVTGYGETRLKNKCRNDVPCTDEEHQVNRRSDFIVVRR